MWAQIVVPTINSARWIRAIVRSYLEAHVSPLFMVDSQSTDRTFEAIVQAGARALRVDLTIPRVEALVPQIRHHVPPGWVFRVDDDEFPSADLLARLQGPRPNAKLDSIAIQRRWIRRTETGRLQRADCRLWIDSTGEVGGDHQWRIFHTERVTYSSEIHTPGFVPVSWETLPDSAYLIHFDWLIRSEAERSAKMARYDQQHPHSGARHWMYYLHEKIPLKDVRWVELETHEFNQLANEVAPLGAPPCR
jgi:glycosyltransferase involved in cell wall biosynthesis